MRKDKEINPPLTGDYNSLQAFADKNGMEFIEYGEQLIGAAFIVLKDMDEPDLVASYVMTGYDNANYYKRIYSDFDNQFQEK